MGTAIRYLSMSTNTESTTALDAPHTVTLAEYAAEDFPRADYRAYLHEIADAGHDITYSKVNPDGEIIIILSNRISYIFCPDDARNTKVLLVLDEDALSEDDPNAPDDWYDEDDGEDTTDGMPAIDERAVIEAEADRDCAAMLRKGIVDFMAMAEAFHLIDEGLQRVTRRHESNTVPYQARVIRLRMLCGLAEGESWCEAKMRYEAVLA